MFKKIIVLGLVCWWVLGCAALLVGTGVGVIGSYYWQNGVLTVSYPYEMITTYQAAIDTATELGYHSQLYLQQEDITQVVIDARNLQNYACVVTLEGNAPQVTTVTVKFGWLGDREKSVLYHTYLQRQLNNTPE